MLRFIGILALTALVLAACSGDEEPADPITPTPPPPTATRTAEPEATATQAMPPAPTSPAPGVRVVPFTAWLVEAGSGVARTIIEDEERAWLSAFAEDEESVYLMRLGPGDAEAIEFDLQGTELRRGRPEALCASAMPSAPAASGSFEVMVCDARLFGPGMSPDGRWALTRGGSGFPTPIPCMPSCSDMWAVDQTTGEKLLLQPGLQDCGGCDARFGPDWSPSGRYVFFGETGGEQRVFLSDLETRTTRELETGNEITRAPRWAPDQDVLLRPSGAGSAVLENLSAGTSEELHALSWPASFDASGRYAYSPAWGESWEPPGSQQTTVVDLETGEVVASLSGTPSFLHLWREMRAVVSGGDEIIVALEHAEDCAGTAVYASTTRVACVEAGTGAVVSPDGSKVAVARVTGQTGHIRTPSIESVSLTEYEVVVLDVATATESVVGTGAVGDQSPLFQWTADSTHLIVSWPVHSGL